MGVRLGSAGSNTLQISTLPQSTEAVVVITPPLILANDNAAVFLNFYANWLTGPGATSTAFKVHRGLTTAGPLVQLAGSVAVSGNVFAECAGCLFDLPGVVGQVQYCLTLQQVGATGTGTMNDACLLAYVL